MASRSGLSTPFHSMRCALRLLEAVAAHPEGIADDALARRSGIHHEQLSHLMRMLRREGYVRRLPDGGYAAGEAQTELGSGRDRRNVREARLQKALDGLRDTVRAAVYLARYTDGELRIPHHSATDSIPVVNEWVDFRYAAHATAMGKCLLGQLDHDGRQDHFARHKTARLTSRTVTDRRALLTSLERQPATMPVLDLQEYAVGTLCAAVPLTAGSLVGALAVSLPVGEAHRLRSTAEALNEQAAPTLLRLAL